jgi:cell division protein FtsI (penicillin-binding protein 3)
MGQVRRLPARSLGGFRPRVRLIVLLVLMIASLLVVAGRLVWVQGVSSEHFVALASGQRDRTVTLPALRGSIVDRNGHALAMSVDAKTLIANPRLIVSPQATAQTLAPLLGMQPADLATRLSNGTSFAYVARRIDPQVAASVLALGIPGIQAITEPLRVYPDGQLAAHVVGFTGTDAQGLAGLESTYNSVLSGKAGSMAMQTDPQGRVIVSAKSQTIAPVAGDDVVLTLDQDIQYEAEAALAQAVQTYNAKGGTIVVMRPSTGELLGLANFPTFDPNAYPTATAASRADRAVQDVYEPGSASKVITAAAALESGAVNPDEVMSVPDTLHLANATFHDAEPHKVLNITLPQILEQSSNVGTIQVALKVGKDRLSSYLQKFGYGKATGVGLPGESSGLLPAAKTWSATQLPTAAIGQGLAVTAMQMMSVYSTVANGGVWVQPRIVAGRRDASGRLTSATAPLSRRVIRPETAQTLTSMLLEVVGGSTGTGGAAAVPGYEVAGKTGTAQKPVPGGYAGYTASFIGYAPAANPQVEVGVVLDDPTPIWGGSTAAPTFKIVMQNALQRLGIGPGPVLPAGGAPLQSGLPSGGTPLPGPARSGGVPGNTAPSGTATPVAPGVAE